MPRSPCYTTRRPLIGIALSTATGMLLAAAGIARIEHLLSVALVLLIISALLIRLPVSGVLLFGCVALVAACRFMVCADPVSAAAVERLQPQLPLKEVQLVGRLVRTPDYHPYRSGHAGAWVLSIACEGMQRKKGWETCSGRIQVRITNARADAAFQRGERILFRGTLRPRDFPGGDPVELAVFASDGWRRLSDPPRFSLSARGQRLREAAARRLSVGMQEHPDPLAVYKALLLGYRKAVPHAIYRRFRQTGTLHIFAISGLHVGIVGLLITVLLKAMGMPRDRWALLLLPLLLAYVTATGMKSSALRALAMAAVYFLAPLFRRRPDVPVSIAFAALLLLWWKPMEILSAGFIFSFVVVTFIVMAFSAVPDNRIFRGTGRGSRVRTYAASLCITSVAANIASAPLTALFFGTFSPVSLIGNLAVVPLTFCIVLSGWLSILIPPASEIFNYAAWVFINALLGITRWLAALPGAYRAVPPPPLTALLFWYAGWIKLLVHARTPRRRAAAMALVSLAVILTGARALL
jgi:ComEC/Rec2-related protein